MASVFYGVAVLAGLLFRRSPLVTVGIFALMIILSAFAQNTADLSNYEFSFYGMEDDVGRYIGFTTFLQAFSATGMSFEVYRVIFYLLAFGMTVFAARLWTTKVNAVLALILISYYGIESIQMKSCLADAIVILFLSLYFHSMREDGTVSKKRLLLVLSGLLLGASMHYSTAYFLLCLLLFHFFGESRRYFTFMILFGISATYILNSVGMGNLFLMVANLGLTTDEGYLGAWGDGAMRMGFLVPFAWVGVYGLFLYFARFGRRKAISSRALMQDTAMIRFLSTVVLLLPLLYINVTFDRLFRVYLFFAYLLAVRGAGIRYCGSQRVLIGLCILFLAVFIFVFDMAFGNWDGTLGGILNSNAIF